MSRFTEDDIHAHLSSNRGHRFRVDHLATTFGVGSKAMRATLENLVRQQRIRQASDGKRSFFYVPSDEDLRKEAALKAPSFRPLKVDPVYLERVEAARAHRKAFPSVR